MQLFWQLALCQNCAARKVLEIMKLKHIPVLSDEIKEALPATENCHFLDVTAGGGGHFSQILNARPSWTGEAWDRDPEAQARVEQKLTEEEIAPERWRFCSKEFGDAPSGESVSFDFILADLGVSSFQLDDMARGMSLKSEEALDFRMNPNEGHSFLEWLTNIEERKLESVLYRYAEEARAKSLARQMKSWGAESFQSAKALADSIARFYNYREESRKHPATRVFQALRIAVNDELGQIESLLSWAPDALRPGGRLAVISFHSLEDRLVKNAFRDWSRKEGFELPFKKPLVPTEAESRENPRSRSSKLRILQRH